MQMFNKEIKSWALSKKLLEGQLEALSFLRAGLKGAVRPEINLGQFRILACVAKAPAGEYARVRLYRHQPIGGFAQG